MANLLRKGYMKRILVDKFIFFLFLIEFRDRSEQVLSSIGTRSTTALPAGGVSKKSVKSGFNSWDLSQIWIESVSKEQSTRKQWEQMYGWMADYDPKVLFLFIN